MDCNKKRMDLTLVSYYMHLIFLLKRFIAILANMQSFIFYVCVSSQNKIGYRRCYETPSPPVLRIIPSGMHF